MAHDATSLGRPSLLTPDLAREICDRLSSGQSLREICRDERMPGLNAVRRWVADDRDGFRAQYAQAREAQTEHFADEILEIADDATNDWVERRRGQDMVTEVDKDHVSRSALRIESRKWLMARMAPKKWGDKTQLEHTGKDGGPLQVTIQGDDAAL